MRTTLIAALVTLTGVSVAAAWTASAPATMSSSVTRTVGEGWLGDFDAAVAQAKAEKKDLFVDFTGSDWCGWCIRLNEEVFSHEEFLSAVKKDFVLVALDYPRSPEAKAKVPNPERNKALSEKYQITGFPTILLMTPDGDVFGKTGYRKGGPTPYVEHVKELLTTGKAEIAEVAKLVSAWTTATGDAKGAAWDKLADTAEKLDPESVSAAKFVEPLRSALKDDADNGKGRKLRATKLLLRFGNSDSELLATAVELDPKNELGMHELALVAMFQDQSQFEDPEQVKALIEKLEKFDTLGKIHDKEAVVVPFALGAFLSRDVLSDMERAKKHAQRAKDIGSSNQRLLDAMDEILGG
jgi:thiol-disulfide isomerase/thioredoxin